MPFPNEHAARQTDPGKYETFRRVHPKGFPEGIDAIMGIRNVAGRRVSEIQSLRFARDKWTPEKARAWLKDHDFKTTLEEASGSGPVKKSLWAGVLWD
jgi:hypothetical protein